MDKIFTLLLADLVDSTAVNTRLGDDAMGRLWDEHDDLSRELASLHQGFEVDRTDGFLMLFDTPANAVRFACDYHRRLDLLAVSMRAKVGIHIGPVRLRENSARAIARGAKPFDVLGIAKAKTARLMGLARGGQTLVSAELAPEVIRGNWHLVSHGYWSLKGVDEPAEIFEVGDKLAPFVPPADGEKATRVVLRDGHWVGLAKVPHWLPAERDSFIGRRLDLQAIARGFEGPQSRLIVLHGPGGIGKTRLAVRFAWSWLGHFPDGAFFCDLTAARGADGILHAVAHALEVPLGADPQAQLAHALAARGTSLLILDNFEQVSAHAPETLGLWLDAAPDLRFLVTSRETLGIPGEHVVEVDSLPIEEAATLFAARARSAGANVEGNDFDSATVARLTSLLDGLPLAIELAAARSRVMSPSMLLSRMNERFSLLEGRGGRASRQATMRTVIDASWDGMTEPEQLALAQLSVFEGGFDLVAAEAVLEIEGKHVWVPGMLHALVDKSLLRCLDANRFTMLSIIQSYAVERLGRSPQMAAAVTRRHWEHYAKLDDAAATAQRCIELENLVAACRRATAAGHADAAAACMLPAWTALRRVGPLSVANDLARSLSALAAASASANVIASWVDAAARFAAGEYALARPSIEHGLRIARVGVPPILESRLRCTAGELETVVGNHDEALLHLKAALTAATVSAIPSLKCQVLNAIGALETERGALDDARASYDRALDVAQLVDDLHWQGGVLGNIAVLEYARGNLTEAASALSEALRMAEASSDLRWEGNARCNLGLILLDQGKSEGAITQFSLASEIARRVGHRTLANTVQCNIGLAYEAAGDFVEACRAHLDAVQGARGAGDPRGEVHFSAYLGSALCRADRLQESEAVLTHALQLAASVGDRLLHALVLVSAAELNLRRNDPDAARTDIEKARFVATDMGFANESELGRRLDCVEALIRG